MSDKKDKKVIILAIESSCDDTSASVIIDGVVKSNRIANQSVHEQYGGVVPELASRAHMANIVPVVKSALEDAGVEKKRPMCGRIYKRSRAFGKFNSRSIIR